MTENPSLLIITYDLHDPRREGDVLEYIKKRIEWAKLSNSSYLVVTKKEPKEVRDDLAASANNEITCFISPVILPWAGYGLAKDAVELLKKYL